MMWRVEPHKGDDVSQSESIGLKGDKPSSGQADLLSLPHSHADKDQLSLYREIFARSPNGIAIIDLEGEYIEQNQAHYDLLGYSIHELTGQTPALHMGKEVFDALTQKLIEEGTFSGEVLSTSKDGRLHNIMLSAFTVHDDLGKPVCYVGIKRDITARKQAEEGLRKSQENLESSVAQRTTELADAVKLLKEEIAERQRTEREGQVFFGLGSRLSAADTPEKIGEAVLQTINGLWKWDSCFLSLRLSGRAWFETVFMYDTIDGNKVSFPMQRHRTQDYQDFAEEIGGYPSLINRASDDEHRMNTFGDKSRCSASLLHAAIGLGGDMIGLISVQSYSQNQFAAHDKGLMQRLADAVAPAVRRFQAEMVNAALSELGQKLIPATTQEEVARLVVATADKLMGWDSCLIETYIPEHGYFVPVLRIDIVNGERAELDLPNQAIKTTDFIRKIMQEGGQLILRSEDSLASPRLSRMGDETRPSASLIFVPIHGTSGIAGIMSIQSYTFNAYDREDLALLQSLANLCGAALERTWARQQLQNSEKELRALFGAMTDVILMVDTAGRYVRLSLTESSLPRYPDFQTEGSSFRDRFSREQAEYLIETVKVALATGKPITIEYPHAQEGVERWYSATVSPMDERTVIWVARDITERKRVEEQLQHGAFHDTLTDLPNRALFADRLARAISQVRRRPGYAFAILFLDLDRFKVVNDSLGHILGDQLLMEAAERLELCLRPGDMVARLGGDEFTVFLDAVDDISEAIRIAERIQEGLGRPFILSDHTVFTSASIGVLMSSPEYKRPDDVLRDADLAMYRAKAHGKARYEIFDESMRVRAVNLLRLENDLRQATERREFLLYYQPIIALETGYIAGFEALLRWDHPQRGFLMPSDFIPVAEETGLIVQIGWWALREACQKLQSWRKTSASNRNIEMSVNISARQFRQSDFIERIAALILETGISPTALKLEITESTIMENAETATAMLLKLRALEIQLHVDDFGVGHSSLSYLHRFPIDALKIDQSFVTGIGLKGDTQIIKTIVALANGLNMETIAEGVDGPETLALLRELGVRFAQGNFLSAAVSAEQAGKMIAEKRFL